MYLKHFFITQILNNARINFRISAVWSHLAGAKIMTNDVYKILNKACVKYLKFFGLYHFCLFMELT
jgi:hypothetical protein